MRAQTYSLRPIVETDLEVTLEWRNLPRIRNVMYTDHLITPEEHYRWFKKLQKDTEKSCFVFEVNKNPVGVVNLSLDVYNQRATWGFYIGEDRQPKGMGMIMGYLAMRYIFEDICVQKLCGESFAFNTPSVSFHKRLGFMEEGRLKKHVLKNGHYEDVILFAVFQEQWNANKKELINSIRQRGFCI